VIEAAKDDKFDETNEPDNDADRDAVLASATDARDASAVRSSMDK
jgi:hypothetical protein